MNIITLFLLKNHAANPQQSICNVPREQVGAAFFVEGTLKSLPVILPATRLVAMPYAVCLNPATPSHQIRMEGKAYGLLPPPLLPQPT